MLDGVVIADRYRITIYDRRNTLLPKRGHHAFFLGMRDYRRDVANIHARRPQFCLGCGIQERMVIFGVRDATGFQGVRESSTGIHQTGERITDGVGRKDAKDE